MMPHADPAERANEQLVERLIAAGALWSPTLIAAFRATPRHRFLDRVFVFLRRQNSWREILTRDPGEEQLRLLYSDKALITHLQGGTGPGAVPISSSSQPSLMAQMLEDLQLQAGHRVLEVGAGTGYNAALMAHVAGPGRVVAVDVDRSVLAEAWDHLRAFPERQVLVQHADGRQGFAPQAPYDRMMVTAATPDLEPAWLEQLAEGGTVVAPLALAPGLAFVVRGTVRGGVLRGQLTRPAYFMPLRAEGEVGPTEALPPPVSSLQTVEAPWAGWFDGRRPRCAWPGVSQALAFRGWLNGWTVYHQALAAGETVFGVGRQQALCWLGERHWYVTGETGVELGQQLWRGFLEAGGPRPQEYELSIGTASTSSVPVVEAFHRATARWQYLWTLPARRQRLSWY